MRIVSVNNFRTRPSAYQNNNQNKNLMRSCCCFKNRQQRLRMVEDVLFGDLVVKPISYKTSSSVSLVQPKKSVEDALGSKLARLISYQNAITSIDYSEFIGKLQNSIIKAGFVSFAAISRCDEDLQKTMANTYLADNFYRIISATKFLGEDTLCYATSLKRERFEKLLAQVELFDTISASNALRGMLIQKLNPTKSDVYEELEFKKNRTASLMKSESFKEFHELNESYSGKIKNLQSQLKELKQNFSDDSKQKIKNIYSQISELRTTIANNKPTEFLELEKALTDIKVRQNNLVKESVKDPQEKIELFYLYKSLLSNSISVTGTGEEFFKLFTTEDEAKMLKSHIKQAIKNHLKLGEDEINSLYDMKLDESPYFNKLLEADYGTASNLGAFFSTILKEKKAPREILDNLVQNKNSRELFEAQGYDYDAWVGFDKEKDCLQFVNGSLVIKKVDMSDIKHSLFLGNYVGCCTAIGSGSKAQFAPNYVLCNFVQAIELLEEGRPVSNTMCYIAQEDSGQNVLVLDNIEIRSQYKDYDYLLDIYIQYAKKLATDIGAPDIPIYMGARQKFKIDEKKSIGPINLKIIGSSAGHGLYLDSLQQPYNRSSYPISPEDVFTVSMMYKIG